MPAPPCAFLPRFAALTLVWFLTTSTITFAAGGRLARPRPPAPERDRPAKLVVPDVRGEAFVFAKGALEDEGFAWRVEGRVGGYAPNPVAGQHPVPGTTVVDNGAPTIVLRLAPNPDYAEEGVPDVRSELPGTKAVLAGGAPAAPEDERRPRR